MRMYMLIGGGSERRESERERVRERERQRRTERVRVKGDIILQYLSIYLSI